MSAPRPLPPTAVTNWLTRGLSVTPAALRRLAGSVTLTCSPGKKGCAGANVRLLVPAPLSVPVRRPRDWVPNTRIPAAVAAVMGDENGTVTAVFKGAWRVFGPGVRPVVDSVVRTV